MPLDDHKTVGSPATHGQDSAAVTTTRLNDNFGLLEANDQAIEGRLEDAFFDTHGSGIINGMSPSIPVYGGLSIDVAAGIMLVGFAVPFSAGSVTIEASKDPGYIFFKQDATWEVNDTGTPPTGIASVLYATYTSDGYDSLTVTLDARGLHFVPIRAGTAGAVSAGVIRETVAERDLWIEKTLLVLADSGTYASTIVDISVGDAGSTPVTIYTTQANRPTIASGEADHSTDEGGTPDVQSVTEGQVIVFEVDAAATGAQTLGIVLKCRYADIVQ